MRIYLLMVLTSVGLYAQASYKISTGATLTISGTSTLHDWTMTSSEISCSAVLVIDGGGNPAKVESAAFSLPAESLKSGKTAMDKNAYRSLKTDKHKSIMFQLTSARINGNSISCTGNLTVAGTTRQVEVQVPVEIRNGQPHFRFSHKIRMSDYQVEPPSFMFGTVTTGNDILVAADFTLIPVH